MDVSRALAGPPRMMHIDWSFPGKARICPRRPAHKEDVAADRQCIEQELFAAGVCVLSLSVACSFHGGGGCAGDCWSTAWAGRAP